jgi:hypothetical protein
MEEGETRNALKKRDDMRARIEPILPCVPRLQRGSGHVKGFGCLTLRQPLSMKVAILPEEFGAAAAVPALSAINFAMLLIIDDHIHGDLLTQPVSCWNCIG